MAWSHEQLTRLHVVLNFCKIMPCVCFLFNIKWQIFIIYTTNNCYFLSLSNSPQLKLLFLFLLKNLRKKIQFSFQLQTVPKNMSIILIMVHVMTSFVIVIVSVLFVITGKHTNKQLFCQELISKCRRHLCRILKFICEKN